MGLFIWVPKYHFFFISKLPQTPTVSLLHYHKLRALPSLHLLFSNKYTSKIKCFISRKKLYTIRTKVTLGKLNDHSVKLERLQLLTSLLSHQKNATDRIKLKVGLVATTKEKTKDASMRRLLTLLPSVTFPTHILPNLELYQNVSPLFYWCAFSLCLVRYVTYSLDTIEK